MNPLGTMAGQVLMKFSHTLTSGGADPPAESLIVRITLPLYDCSVTNSMVIYNRRHSHFFEVLTMPAPVAISLTESVLVLYECYWGLDGANGCFNSIVHVISVLLWLRYETRLITEY